MVVPGVVVGKTHFGTQAHDGHAGYKLHFFLVDGGTQGQRLFGCAACAGLHDDHRIGHGFSIPVQHQYLQRAGLGQPGQQTARQRCKQDANTEASGVVCIECSHGATHLTVITSRCIGASLDSNWFCAPNEMPCASIDRCSTSTSALKSPLVMSMAAWEDFISAPL